MTMILNNTLLFLLLLSYTIQTEDQEITTEEYSMKVNIGLTDKERKQVVEILHELQANEFALYTKTLKFHWNIQGPFFGPLHAMFKDQYEQLFDFNDELAERCQQLGYEAIGTLEEFKELTTLKEKPGKNPNDQGMIRELVEDHEEVIRQLRKAIDAADELHDEGTNNFLSEVIEKHEKIAWMLRAHLIKQ
jgi:starvation-inducible DNA-binding protein